MNMRWGSLAAGLALGCAAASASATPRSQISPQQFSAFEYQQHLGAELPLDTPWHGMDGRLVTLRSLFGTEPIVLDFDYDHCATLCGTMLDYVTAMLRSMPIGAEQKYRLVAIDIDPQATPSDAAAFALRHGADSDNTVVLTGDENSIRQLADAAGFPYRFDPATGQFAHSAGFVIATPQGRISRYLLGLGWRPFDLRMALLEAAGETIAAPAQRVLLFCYCYDPKTGQYDLAVGNLLKVVGSVSLLSLGGVVWAGARARR